MSHSTMVPRAPMGLGGASSRAASSRASGTGSRRARCRARGERSRRAGWPRPLVLPDGARRRRRRRDARRLGQDAARHRLRAGAGARGARGRARGPCVPRASAGRARASFAPRTTSRWWATKRSSPRARSATSLPSSSPRPGRPRSITPLRSPTSWSSTECSRPRRVARRSPSSRSTRRVCGAPGTPHRAAICAHRGRRSSQLPTASSSFSPSPAALTSPIASSPGPSSLHSASASSPPSPAPIAHPRVRSPAAA